MATQWNAITALVSVKLNRDNYLLWSSQLESVMESQELIQFIDGTFPAPSETIVKDGKIEINLEFAVWKRSDRLALSWIKATVSEPVFRQIVTRLDTMDGDIVQITMNGFPIEYESFLTLISANSSNASITFSELFDLLLTQEKRLNMFKLVRVDPHKSVRALPQDENQIAFNTIQGRGIGRGGFRGRQGGRFQGRGN
ncbi:hypothetical protein EJ110_NYTH46522 [Nymphaea thermarum]|nr:hypothetical protein EJ110_NYTH46522 [Nymphaea thermarum]